MTALKDPTQSRVAPVGVSPGTQEYAPGYGVAGERQEGLFSQSAHDISVERGMKGGGSGAV